MELYKIKYVWLLFGLIKVTVANKVNTSDVLFWSNRLHLKALRHSVVANVTDEFELWETSEASRIDHNNGQWKSIVRRTKSKIYGIKYEIDVKTKIVCRAAEGNNNFQYGPETILPTASYFKANGYEVINGNNCTKFISDLNDKYSKETTWAVYRNNGWIPIKYEIKEYNSLLNTTEKHEIWNFYDYHIKFSHRHTFGVRLYKCGKKSLLDMNNDVVTKHLKFIDTENEKHVDHVFKAFIKTYYKTYSDDIEKVTRRKIFKNNIRLIKEHNRHNTNFKLSINKFADKLPQEMTKQMGLLRRPKRGKLGLIPFPYSDVNLMIAGSALPKEYDARHFNLVSAVKNEADSATGWAHGPSAAVEGALARINGGRLIALSHQALTDCVSPVDAHGYGKTIIAAYEWMTKYGLPTESEYGIFDNKDGVCKIKNVTTKYPIRGYTNVTPLSIEALKVALVYHGPLSVSVIVNPNFQLYSSGILYDTQCGQYTLQHDLALVGYGEQDRETFWILKNSWGPSWGLDGYIQVSARNNICGISAATYAVF